MYFIHGMDDINIFTRLLGEYLRDYDIPYKTRSEWIDNRKSNSKMSAFLKIDNVLEYIQNVYLNEYDDDFFIQTNEDNVITLDYKTFFNTYKSNFKYAQRKSGLTKALRTYGVLSGDPSRSISIDLKKVYKLLEKEDLLPKDSEFENKYDDED